MTWHSRWGTLRSKRQTKGAHGPRASAPPKPELPVADLAPPAPPLTKVAVVLATYNRRSYLEAAIESVRDNAGIDCHFIVTDGGSSDGSRAWLAAQSDVTIIGQRGHLTGAVRAFNHGFSLAVERGYPYVFHFNDDAEFITPNAMRDAVDLLELQPEVGAVAFELDFRGDWGFENVHGYLYPNFGLIRRQAGMDVAQAQGDSTGRRWWCGLYKTYAADSELGCWLHRLGWKVHAGKGWRVHDCQVQDELRVLNESDNPNRPDSNCFWMRWPHRKAVTDESWDPSKWMEPVEGLDVEAELAWLEGSK